ncbi:MAG: CbiX/SirB N-terminal domain-containing protein, partial [Bellilinea sp.]
GSPPNDFPKRELAEFFGLHARVEAAPHSMDEASRTRYAALDLKMRQWPRTAENDPFHAASLSLARQIEIESGLETRVCFNEFCAPTLEEVVKGAVEEGFQRIVMVTPMMTRGGEHAEHEIPAQIQTLQSRYPANRFIYAWPFEEREVARFLSAQVRRFLE